MAVKHARPLSPHLSIWKPGVHMFVSILNRVMGVAMATVGTLTLVAWLIALASGEQAYGVFLDYAKGLWGLGIVVAIGLSFAFFFHMLAGIRHFVMDVGAGYELKSNRLWAWMTLFGAALLTAGSWLIVLGKSL